MGHFEDIQNPLYHVLKCVCYVILFIFLFPPLLVFELSSVNQKSFTLSITDFYISTNASNSNQSIIHFNLYLDNLEDRMRVYYRNLNLTFSYNASGGIVPVGNYTVHAFRQGLEKHTERKDYVVMTNGISWQEISKNLSSSSSGVVFRVDLSGAVKFREYISKAKSKTRKIMAWANVEVDRNTGKKISKKAIMLKQMIVHDVSGWVTFAIIFYVLVVLCCPCWFCPLAICCRDACGQ